MFFSTFFVTQVMTLILLYGNLTKNDEIILTSFSHSPALTVELCLLLLPYCLSIGLPFGFCLAFLILIGRAVSSNEILAVQTLGISRIVFFWPVLLSALLVSVVTLHSTLEWGPKNRAEFDILSNRVLWNNLDSLLDSEGEIEFDFGGEIEVESKDSLNSLLSSNEKINKITLSVVEVLPHEWINLRITLFDDKGIALAFLNAKRASANNFMEDGQLKLDLQEVDFEPAVFDSSKIKKEATFVSFKRWKRPLVFALPLSKVNENIKRMGFFELLTHYDSLEDEFKKKDCSFHLNKNLAHGLSPFFLIFLLFPLSLEKKYDEFFKNLSLGILVIFIYFTLGNFTSHFPKQVGLGSWCCWLPNGICLILGLGMLAVTSDHK